MKLPNEPRILAATYNPVSDTKMISFLVDFPTVLLAELRTHRILTQGSLYEHSELDNFNLSANSARAIPHNRYLQKVIDNPFVPIWTKQQSSMSGEMIANTENVNDLWHIAKDEAISVYKSLIYENAHKQNANRLLAPFAWTTCILSGTEWENFFRLRTAPEAQPEFREIALILKGLYDNADWRISQYHIPYFSEIEELYFDDIHKIVSKDESLGIYSDYFMKVSASFCAKLSYNTQDKPDTLEKHMSRVYDLTAHKHQEPFSHQAVAMNQDEYENMFTQSIVKINGKREIKRTMGVAYNLRGFIPQRYMLENY
jgi:hypothetical protein